MQIWWLICWLFRLLKEVVCCAHICFMYKKLNSTFEIFILLHWFMILIRYKIYKIYSWLQHLKEAAHKIWSTSFYLKKILNQKQQILLLKLDLIFYSWIWCFDPGILYSLFARVVITFTCAMIQFHRINCLSILFCN